MARPTILNDELEERIASYLDVYQEELQQVVPTVVGLCSYVGVSKSTIYSWKQDKLSDVLMDTLQEIEEQQHIKLVNGGLSNQFNSVISKLMLCNHGYSDKQEVDNKSSDGSMSPVHDESKYKAAQSKLSDLD